MKTGKRRKKSAASPAAVIEKTATSPVASTLSGAVPTVRASLTQRIPWLWYDYVVARTPMPFWVPSLLLFFFLYAVTSAIAFAAGDLPRFLGDIRYLILVSAPIFASLPLGYVPRASDRLWTSIAPWLANSEEEMIVLRASIQGLQMRFFWVVALLFGIVQAAYALPGQNPWAQDYPDPGMMQNIDILYIPFVAYFIGGAFSIVTVGLSLLAYRMSRDLVLRRGFILHGGKASLRPFNYLLWSVWGTFTLPVILIIVLLLAIDPTITSGVMGIIGLASTGILVLPTIVVPQLFMNRWLAKEKVEQLRALQDELTEVASLPESKDPLEALPRLLRLQFLDHQIRRVESFSPTLVDARFVIQIATSVTAIIAAQFLLRTVLAGVL